MSIASVLVGVLALLTMIAGVFFTPVPYVGAVLSFGSPILALVGIVLSGVAMSRAKQEGESSGLAVAGLVLNILGFVFGAAVAVTCGLCNMACSQRSHGFGDGGFPDGGLGGGSLAAELHRMSLVSSLRSMRERCVQDPSGASNAEFFHPSVAPQLQASSCSLTPEAVEAYGRSCRAGQHPCVASSQVQPSSPQAQAATAAGLDPRRCYLFRSGDGRIVLCDDGGFPRILHWENVNAVR